MLYKWRPRKRITISNLEECCFYTYFKNPTQKVQISYIHEDKILENIQRELVIKSGVPFTKLYKELPNYIKKNKTVWNSYASYIIS